MLTRLAARMSTGASGNQSIDVFHDIRKQVFKIVGKTGNELACLEYRLRNQDSRKSIDFYHTYTSPESQGKGLAGRVVKVALAWAKQNEYLVIPSCSYVSAFIEKNPEWRDLVHVVMQDVDFWFPGIPYPVQCEFMDKAYHAISTGGICVLESPTGTGKSLSLICGSLAWLRDNRTKTVSCRILTTENSLDPSLPAWIRRQAETKALEDATDLVGTWQEFKALMCSKAGRIGTVHDKVKHELRITGIKRKALDSVNAGTSVDENEYIPKDEVSGHQLPEDVTGTDRRVKVIFASRTHSQISQLVKELKRTKYKDDFNVVTLGSRSQLCVNPSIPRGVSANFVNDLCRRLVDDSKCDLKKSTESLQKLIVSTPMDIEDMYSAGSSTLTAGCPYYASREMEKFADVLMVPHSSLVNVTTRTALGIDLSDNIVVIDEAHSILDLINSSRSLSLQLVELESVLAVLLQYITKYTSRLSPKNLVSIKQLQFFCKRLSVYGRSTNCDTLISVETFMTLSKVVDIDIASVLILLENNQFARKLVGFGANLLDIGSEARSIYTIMSLLIAIHTSCDSDRVFLKQADGVNVSIEFVAIDAESELANIARSAKALLLVSGTMKPFSEFEAVSILAGCPFDVFSGVYNVEATRLLSRVVTTSKTGTDLIFNSLGRSTPDHINAFADVLEMCIVTRPNGGIVIFVSSYGYCAELAANLCRIGLNKRVPLFVDSPKANVSELLKLYSNTVVSDGSAILLSVVNGSLSEGIDFKDNLCRCLIVVGLPYANPTDPVLKERMQFFDKQHSRYPKFPTGQAYYENRCIKAVNQAIGRSIRHSKDWSAIILIDCRYSNPKNFLGISEWVKKVSRVSSNMNELKTELAKFFSANSKTIIQ